MTIEEIAQVAHEVNRAYCQALGDYSQPPWRDAPDWQRASAVTGVKFHVSHPAASPPESHAEWLRTKEAEGWAWGLVKDADAKTHPCMLPFDQLPEAQRAKDYIFKAIVDSLKPHSIGDPE